MFTLNPLGNPDAWWQHAIMVLVAASLGYIIGNNKNAQNVSELENKLTKLDSDIAIAASKDSNEKQPD